MKVFFYVQHLLGVGHLKRAATLARALAADGFEVTLASGGMPRRKGIDVLQLPPASSDAAFKQLLDEHGNPVDDAWKARRRDALLAAWRASDADVLMIELFPFGRRQMRFELLPLLDAAQARATPSADRLLGARPHPVAPDARAGDAGVLRALLRPPAGARRSGGRELQLRPRGEARRQAALHRATW